MKELCRITLKDMIANKKRTLVTIIGITLSSMLLFLVALAFSIYRDQGLKYVIDQNGSQHAIISNVDLSKKDIIYNNVKKAFYYSKVGELTYLDYGLNLYTISDDYDADIDLIGNLPKNEKEIVISSDLAKIYKLDLNDYLDEYTIVGIYQSNRYVNFDSNVVLTKQENSQKGIFYVYFDDLKDMSGKVRNVISKLEINNLFDEPSYNINYDLLSYYFEMDGEQALSVAVMILSLMIIMFVLGFVTLFVIYNSFAISVNERKKTYGMYKSMGATPNQILKSVFFEASIISLIAIPLGFLLSLVIGGITIVIMNKWLTLILSFKLTLAFYPIFYLFALFFIFISVFIASLMPAKRASETSPIDAIRETKVYTKKGELFKKRRLIKKVFGIEGVISSKNSTSNYRKYNVTVFSIVVGCIFFLVTAIFANIKKLEVGEVSGSENISIMLSYDNMNEIKKVSNLILESKDIDEYMIVYTSYKYEINIQNCLEYCQLHALYLVDDKIYSEFERTYGTGPYIINAMGNFDKDKVNVDIVLDDVIKKEQLKVIEKVPASIKDKWGEMFYNGLILPDNLGYEAKNAEILIKSQNYIELDKHIKSIQRENRLIYNNSLLDQHKANMEFKVSKMLIYLVIGIVVLTTVTSVVNTVTTNLQSRKREFAVLRSIGLSPKQFEKMIFFESLMLSSKALLFGILISLCIIFGIIDITILTNIGSNDYSYIYYIFPLKEIIICIVSVYIIVYISFYISTRKLKKDNIIDNILDNHY